MEWIQERMERADLVPMSTDNSLIGFFFFFFFGLVFVFLAVHPACGSSQVRERTHTAAATQATAVTMLDPSSAAPQENS